MGKNIMAMILDKFPAQTGYNYIFATSVLAASLCVVFCILFKKKTLGKKLDAGHDIHITFNLKQENVA